MIITYTTNLRSILYFVTLKLYFGDGSKLHVLEVRICVKVLKLLIWNSLHQVVTSTNNQPYKQACKQNLLNTILVKTQWRHLVSPCKEHMQGHPPSDRCLLPLWTAKKTQQITRQLFPLISPHTSIMLGTRCFTYVYLQQFNSLWHPLPAHPSRRSTKWIHVAASAGCALIPPH